MQRPLLAQSGHFNFALPRTSELIFDKSIEFIVIYFISYPVTSKVHAAPYPKLLGDESFIYDESHFLITSLELPARSEVTVASAERPCSGMVYRLDLGLIAELIARENSLTQRVKNNGSGLGVDMVTEDLLDAFRRLLRLLDHTGDIPVLVPLFHREIHYLLLQSDQAAMLRKMAHVDGQGYRIAGAIDWIKQNFTKPLRIDELAEQVQMSTSSFHNHFRRLTSMSPLQYQKSLRLHEAKRLMINQHYSAVHPALRSKLGTKVRHSLTGNTVVCLVIHLGEIFGTVITGLNQGIDKFTQLINHVHRHRTGHNTSVS